MIIVKQGNDGRHVRFPKNRVLKQRERSKDRLVFYGLRTSASFSSECTMTKIITR